MDRVFQSGASATPPTAPVSPSTGYPKSGDPSGAVPPTKPGPWWYHMVTEEMRKVITDVGMTPDHTDLGQLSRAIQSMGQPTGAVIYFASNQAPTGYLKANGALVSRTTYATLFSVIGTVFGVGDGSTTFALPNLRGEFIRGWDDGRGIDSGRAFGVAQTDDFKSHNHGLSMFASTSFDSSGGPAAVGADTGGTSQGVASGSNTIALTGGAETRPRNVALLACIKF